MSADRLDDNDFLEIGNMPLAVEQRLCLKHDGASASYAEDTQLVERDVSTMGD
jgi:hypothetical protein